MNAYLHLDEDIDERLKDSSIHHNLWKIINILILARMFTNWIRVI